MSQTVGRSLAGRKGGEQSKYPCEDFFSILDEQEARRIQRLKDLHERKLCQTVDKHKNIAKQLSSDTRREAAQGAGPPARQGPSQGRRQEKQMGKPKRPRRESIVMVYKVLLRGGDRRNRRKKLKGQSSKTHGDVCISAGGSKQMRAGPLVTKLFHCSSANQTKRPPEPAAVKARVPTTAPMKGSSAPRKLRRSFPIKDELDFLLNSTFRPDLEVFPHKSDVFRQPETIGCDDRYTPKGRPPVGARCAQTEGVWFNPSRGQGRKGPKKLVSTGKVGNQGQSLVIGGVDERRSIFNVKMGIAPDHMSRAMAGYTRKDDGSFYSV
uniref:Uncharacterized protein n=1 Tax=Timema cristinae TaxID=61476 RepID=A0A7R9D5G3_TIMCR|nr:unnamed protein product [Timema cristinae]